MAEIVRIVGANNIDIGNGWWTGATPPPTGSTLSRILRNEGHSFDMVVARQGEPLLDSELNLMQQIVGDKLDRLVHQLALTGWTKAPGYPVPAGNISTSTSNIQWNSTTNQLKFLSDAWLVAKGMFIHVTNPDDVANQGGFTVNIADVPPDPGVVREDLLFIEFWFEEVGPDGIGFTDSASRLILKEGGLGNGVFPQSDVNESLVDPLLNIETTRRVQLRYRLRVAPSTGSPVGGTLSMFTSTASGGPYAWGLTSATGAPNLAIVAMGANDDLVPGYPFLAVESPPSLSDPSGSAPYLLWRTDIPADPKASASALKTVDGYSYAVPMLKLIRTSGNEMSLGELRNPSRLFIPDHSIHARQLAPGAALNGAGVTGGLSTNGTVIEPETVKGGVGGDVGPHTITTYNLAAGTVDEDAIGDGAVNIENINANVGLPTRYLLNNTGERVYNGSVVFVVGDTFIKSTAANPVTLPIMGVVEHHIRGSSQNYVEAGFSGYVRLAGIAAGTLTSGTVTVNQYLVPATSAEPMYYPAVAGVVNIFGQVMKTYSHDAGDPVGLNRADILMFGEVLPNASVDATKIAAAAVKLTHIHTELLTGDDDAPLLRKLGRSGTPYAEAHDRALPADDERLSNSRPPTGPAGGDLTGEYPNPTIAAGAVTSAKIADGTIVPGDINAAYVDGIPSVPSLRRMSQISGSLGGGLFAVSDDSPALTNARIPTGSAGGSLTGTYPNPTIAVNAVQTAHILDGNVTTAKIPDAAITTAKILDGSVISTKLATNAVTTAKMVDENVTAPKIGPAAVITSKIANLAADYTKIGLVPFLRLRRIDSPDGQQVITGSGTQSADIVWAAAQFDSMAAVGSPQWGAGSPTLINLQVPGIYQFILQVNWNDMGPGLRGDPQSFRECSITFSPSMINFARNRGIPSLITTFSFTHECSAMYSIASPISLVCSVRHNSGVNQAIGGDSAWATYLNVIWLGPPA